MMDNKLSELSKPVAWKLHHHDRYYFEENADVVAIAESVGKAKGDAVYSQEYVSALEQRITELEYQKSELKEHILNDFEVATLMSTLRKIDVYLPEFLRFCAFYRVDQGVIIDKFIDQSSALKRVDEADLRRDLEACVE